MSRRRCLVASPKVTRVVKGHRSSLGTFELLETVQTELRETQGVVTVKIHSVTRKGLRLIR